MARRAKLILQAAAVLVVVLLVALLGWKVTQQAEGRGLSDALERGERPRAPMLVFDSLHGDGEISLADYRGKALVLNFWASWCEPCKNEAPLLEETWQRYRNEGLVVIGIDAQGLSHRRPALRRALRAHVPDGVRRARLSPRAIREHRVPGDLVRRARRPSGRGAHRRPFDGEQLEENVRGGTRHSGAMRRALVLVLGVAALLAGGRLRRGERRAADARGDGEEVHLSNVPDDARALQRADRRPDARLHQRADRCGRLGGGDRGGPGRAVRRGSAPRLRRRAST